MPDLDAIWAAAYPDDPDELVDAINNAWARMSEFLQHEFGPLVRLLGEHIEDDDD